MAQTQAPSVSSLHHASNSAPGYFEFSPATQSDAAIIAGAMKSSNIHRLDALHARPNPLFEGLPENAHIYASRPLPPVPTLATLRRPASAKSLRSNSAPQRPTLSPKHRTITTDCVNRPLPPLPLRSLHRRGPSLDTAAAKHCVVELAPLAEAAPLIEAAPLRRPRTMRSISFRNFLNRNTYPQVIPEPLRSASSMSESSESSSHDSRHDSVVGDEKPSTPTSATSSRRPSTLSLASLRARKISQEVVPAVPAVPRPLSGKAKDSNGRRWNLFGAFDKPAVVKDVENLPPVPITPPATADLSCRECYYKIRDGCDGYIMGGAHGDACERCIVRSFTPIKSPRTWTNLLQQEKGLLGSP